MHRRAKSNIKYLISAGSSSLSTRKVSDDSSVNTKSSDTFLSETASDLFSEGDDKVEWWNTTFRRSWEYGLLFVVMYNALVLPVRICSFSDYPYYWFVPDYLLDIVLLIDIWFNFNTFGYFENDDDFVIDSNKVRTHYLHGSFLVDLLASLPLEIISPLLGYQYWAIFRINKNFRLARISRYWLNILEDLELREIRFEAGTWRLINFFFGFLLTVHWVAAIMVFMGEYEGGVPDIDRWYTLDTLADGGLFRAFVRALYWTVSTLLTIGFGDLKPRTVLETSYTILVELVGVSIVTFVVASFTSLFEHQDSARAAYERRIAYLERYMVSTRLPDELKHAVLSYFQYLWSSQRGMDEKRVLADMPAHLRAEAMIFLEGDTITRVPFFNSISPAFINSIATVLQPVIFSPGDIIYRIGQQSTDMYFLNRGTVNAMDKNMKKSLRIYEDGSFFGEMSLFKNEPRKENVKAVTYCELFKLTKSDFDEVFSIVCGDDAEEVKEAMLQKALDSDKRKAKLAQMLGDSNFANSNIEMSGGRLMWRNPGSRFRTIWETANFFLLVFFAIVIPYRCAFMWDLFEDMMHYPSALVFFSLDIAYDILLIVDLVLRARFFSITDTANKRLEQDPSTIWHTNRHSWQWYSDVVSVLPFSYLFGAVFGWQYFSFIGVARLLQARKISTYLGTMKILGQKLGFKLEYNKLRLTKLFIQILFLAHWAGCIWYLIGFHLKKNGQNCWIDTEEALMTNQSGFRKYLRSNYFIYVSITTTGYGDILPLSTGETVFTIVIAIFGCLLYFGTIGAISSILSNLGLADREFQEKIDILHLYMRQNSLPADLRARIRAYYYRLWDRQHGIQEATIRQELPGPIREEISAHLNAGAVAGIEIFSNLDAGVQKCITSFFKSRVYLPGDYVVAAGEVANEMFIFNNGRAIIYNSDCSRQLGCLSEGNYFGSVSFFWQTTRSMSVKTVTFCDVSVLSREDLNKVLLIFPSALSQIEEMASIAKRTQKASQLALKANFAKDKIQHMIKVKDDIYVKKSTEANGWVILPSSSFRRIWEILVLFIKLYLAIVIPFRVCFLFDSDDFRVFLTIIVEWGLDLVLLVDMSLSFDRMAYYADGAIVTDREMIRARYMRSLWKDVLASLPADYIAAACGGSIGVISALRLSRLLHLRRVRYYFSMIRIVVRENDLRINTNVIRLMELMFTFFAIAHWLGCIFFLIARVDNSQNTWIDHDDIREANVFVQFSRAFYWAFSTMTVVCFGDIVPVTNLETLFTMLVMILGVFLIAALVGNISNLLANLDAAAVSYQRKLDRFNEYARRQGLPSHLARKVHQYWAHQYAEQKGVDEEAIFADFPKPIRLQVAHHLYGAAVRDQRYFSFFEGNLMLNLVEILKRHVSIPSDFIVRQGDLGHEVYILKSGRARAVYQFGRGRSLIYHTLNPGDIFGDISFFLPVSSMWSVQAITFCEYLVISKPDMDQLMSPFPHYVKRMVVIATNELEQHKSRLEAMVANYSKAMAMPRSKIARILKLGDHNISGTDLELGSSVTEKQGGNAHSFRVANMKLLQSFKRGFSKLQLDNHEAQDNATTVIEDNNNNNETTQTSCTIVPGTTFYIAWHIFIGCIVFYNLFVIPFRLCFVAPHTNTFSANAISISFLVDYILDGFLLADMYLSAFYIGVIKNGSAVLERDSIKQSYRETRLWTDLLAVIPFDLIAIKLSYTWRSAMRLNKLIRIGSFLRGLKQLEVALLRQRKISISTAIIRFLKIMLIFVLVGHWTGCFFYLLGVESHMTNTWPPIDGLQDAHIHQRWTRSVYFAFTAMSTVGYGDIRAVNYAETLYMLFVIIVSLSMFGAVVGTIETGLRDTDADVAQFSQQMEYIRHYMKYRDLPRDLQERINHYYAFTWSKSKGVDERSILQSLPVHLQMDIALFNNREIIERVPLFIECEPEFIKAIAMILKAQVFMPNDFIIRSGEMGDSMYFINHGEVEVSSPDNTHIWAVLREGDYFGEAALLENKPRNANCRSVAHCDVFVLTRDDYEGVLGYFPHYRQRNISKWKKINQHLTTEVKNERAEAKEAKERAKRKAAMERHVEMIKAQQLDKKSQPLKRKSNFMPRTSEFSSRRWVVDFEASSVELPGEMPDMSVRYNVSNPADVASIASDNRRSSCIVGSVSGVVLPVIDQTRRNSSVTYKLRQNKALRTPIIMKSPRTPRNKLQLSPRKKNYPGLKSVAFHKDELRGLQSFNKRRNSITNSYIPFALNLLNVNNNEIHQGPFSQRGSLSHRHMMIKKAEIDDYCVRSHTVRSYQGDRRASMDFKVSPRSMRLKALIASQAEIPENKPGVPDVDEKIMALLDEKEPADCKYQTRDNEPLIKKRPRDENEPTQEWSARRKSDQDSKTVVPIDSISDLQPDSCSAALEQKDINPRNSSTIIPIPGICDTEERDHSVIIEMTRMKS